MKLAFGGGSGSAHVPPCLYTRRKTRSVCVTGTNISIYRRNPDSGYRRAQGVCKYSCTEKFEAESAEGSRAMAIFPIQYHQPLRRHSNAYGIFDDYKRAVVTQAAADTDVYLCDGSAAVRSGAFTQRQNYPKQLQLHCQKRCENRQHTK